MNELLALLKGVIASKIPDAHKVKVADTVVDVLGMIATELAPVKVGEVAAVVGTVAEALAQPAA